jgi:hypothetical protein
MSGRRITISSYFIFRQDGKAGKRFFFEKKNQKTFGLPGPQALKTPRSSWAKVFWLLFFKKVTASLLPHPASLPTKPQFMV